MEKALHLRDCSRGFHWTKKAWYYDSRLYSPDITFGLYYDDGSTIGEMTMTWQTLGGNLVPQLNIFDDGWFALFIFDNLIAKLAEEDNKNITDEQFVEILISCGFKDLTSYKQ